MGCRGSVGGAGRGSVWVIPEGVGAGGRRPRPRAEHPEEAVYAPTSPGSFHDRVFTGSAEMKEVWTSV